jgi:hypothetical protein
MHSSFSSSTLRRGISLDVLDYDVAVLISYASRLVAQFATYTSPSHPILPDDGQAWASSGEGKRLTETTCAWVLSAAAHALRFHRRGEVLLMHAPACPRCTSNDASVYLCHTSHELFDVLAFW